MQTSSARLRDRQQGDVSASPCIFQRLQRGAVTTLKTRGMLGKASAHRHDRAAGVGSWRKPCEHRLTASPHVADPAVVRLRRSGRKIWSITSAPVVMTGRSSRR